MSMAISELSSAFAILALLLHLSFSQELQDLLPNESGSDDKIVTPSLVDDYVNCPPDDGENMIVLGSIEDENDSDSISDSSDYYAYDYGAPDDRMITRVNAKLIELVNEDLLEEASTEGETTPTTDTTAFDGDEEASGENDSTDSAVIEIDTLDIDDNQDMKGLDSRFAEFVEQHPEEHPVMSPNYPNPYPNSVNTFEEYTITGGNGIQINIHDIDMAHDTDFLFIRGGALSDEEEKGVTLTGEDTAPLRFLIPHTTTFSVHFVSQHDSSENQTHKGYFLTYAPFGTVVSLTTPTTTEMIVPREELQWFRREVSIREIMMVSVETWPNVKAALANASNAFVEMHQLKYKPCRADDVKILVQKCPDTWPGYEECVSLEFAIPLRPIVVIEEEPEGMDTKRRFVQGKGFIPLTTTEEPEAEYQLTKANLEHMWNEFGAMALAEVGIEVYKMPENSSVLLIWIAISVCVLAAFIFVLYSIWKIDFFKDYRRISKLTREPQDEDRSELKKKEFDISMFPSPHQIVPSLFPTGDPYGDRANEAQYAYDNSTMNPFAEDLNDSSKFSNNHAPRSHQSPKQQVFEPLSPLDYSPSIVDFNEIPETRSPRRSRNSNPFLPPSHSSGPAIGGDR
ncbi:uncharacterized protein LOC134217736 [Armigeres subalbatus]|uniref:uncharacterized protein LOC134217736 n=1 Tax=Armigeres subalbatus TaxID=124917 RepID=UPI002ED5BAFC